ncbi:hypothetical protein B0I35DRAFT_123128 [Stachybotrys elegans]|uniref:Uncharacterized protein n=1 Tax=Stachybotrys elegans TaxID=80388 RepID=A0A8K0WW00_9HYPO|nr:hypothetical protein B0I35DRAFT_123128 [Stachybotrys elegans]
MARAWCFRAAPWEAACLGILDVVKPADIDCTKYAQGFTETIRTDSAVQTYCISLCYMPNQAPPCMMKLGLVLESVVD